MKITDLFQIFVDDTNRLINDFIIEKKGSIVRLGSEYSKLSPDETAKNLRLYRMANKFTVPSPSDSSRAMASVNAMFDYDSEGITEFDSSVIQDRYLRYQLNLTRFKLRKALKSLKLDYSDFDMPSGETCVSSQGNVSIWSKLKTRDQWRVSSSCLPFFAKIVYNSPGLYYAFRTHCKQYGKMRRLDSTESGYQCFFRYFSKFVTITEVSRITTVPKDNTKDRVILCEPMGNMICQRAIAKAIIKFIENEYGITLANSQDVHKFLISDENNATIDLSNASNSNWYAVIRFMLKDTKLLSYIDNCRISTVVYKQTYHHLNMVAPMGNGFTFELMTLILLSITRQFDSFSHVFGDDIIVHNEVADDVISLLESCGYKINTTKTFVNSPFRESCGGFFHGDYITSFDFWFADDIVGAIANTNKLFYMSLIDPAFVDLHRSIVDLAPVSLLGSHLFYQPFCAIEDRSNVINRHLEKEPTIGNFFGVVNDHIIVHPRYQEKCIRKSKGNVKPSRARISYHSVKKRGTPYTVIFQGKRVNRRFPRKNVKGFILSHYMYCGLVDPCITRDRVVISRN